MLQKGVNSLIIFQNNQKTQKLVKVYFATSRLQGAETCCSLRSSRDDMSAILAGTSRPVLLKNYEHATFYRDATATYKHNIILTDSLCIKL